MKTLIILFSSLLILLSSHAQVLVGEITNLQGIGVNHAVPTGNPSLNTEITGRQTAQIEQIILQHPIRIWILDTGHQPHEFGQLMKIGTPNSWVTQTMMNRGFVWYQAVDRRPRDIQSLIALNALDTVELLIEQGILQICDETNGRALPVYEIYTLKPIPASFLPAYNRWKTLVKGPLMAYDSEASRLACCEEYNGSFGRAAYLWYAGSTHIYNGWYRGELKNVYFAITPEQVRATARTAAIMRWLNSVQLP